MKPENEQILIDSGYTGEITLADVEQSISKAEGKTSWFVCAAPRKEGYIVEHIVNGVLQTDKGFTDEEEAVMAYVTKSK